MPYGLSDDDYERFRDKYREVDELAYELCDAGFHEYGPYTYTRVDFTRYWVCDCCGHELTVEADP